MKFKKVIALLLCAVLTAAALAGCGSTEIRSYSDDNAADAANTDDTRDFSAAYAAYDPDTVVATVGDDEILWGEYFYWLSSCISAVDGNNGALVSDWSADSGLVEGMSYNEYVIENVNAAVRQYHALDMKARELSVELSREQADQIAGTLASDIVTYCGEDATEEDFFEYLAGIYLTRENYEFINRVAQLYYALFDETFGASGEKCSDEDATAFAGENNYVTADHILFTVTDAEGAAMSDEDKAAQLAAAQSVANELKALSGEALLTRFDELKAQYSGDPGAVYYPDGYCFPAGQGQMLQEFEDAVLSLGDYEVSDPVETTAGYHVVLRLPTTADTAVSYVSEGVYYTVRYYAAVSQYDSVVGNWFNEAELVYTDEFEGLDLNKLTGF